MMGWLQFTIQCALFFMAFVPRNIHGGGTPSAGEMGKTGAVHVYEGDDALLTCIIRDATDNTIMWKFDDTEKRSMKVLTAAEERVTADRRFHVLHDEGGQVWVLSIKDTKASDSGIYICEVNSDPIVRSFHKLSVLSRELQPPKTNATSSYGTDGTVEETERMDKGMLLDHNYTECCMDFNVSSKCLGFCVIQNIIEGNTGQDPEQCENDFPSIVRCMADGRNHVPCCVQESIPDICQDVCRGEYTMITDNIKTHFSCSAYTEQTLACIVTGIELLPNAPEDIQIVVLSDTTLNVTWDKPTHNSASVNQYIVNVTMLRSFDNDPSDMKINQNASWAIVTPHSIQVKVPSSEFNIVIRNLTPYTMYEVTMTAHNTHGSSLPSYANRIVTLPRGNVKPTTGSKPPPLPDTKGCCLKKGITHLSCVDKLCDPLISSMTAVTDLMICAPWASQTYSCLTNGIDHTPCCKARGLPSLCQELCSGNLTEIDYSYFKCIKYMGDYTNCLMRGYGVVPSPPRHVRITNVDATFAILHWEPPKSLANTVVDYNVHFRSTDDIYMVARGVHSPYILEKLRPDSIYEVYVEALNSHGPGEPSQRIVFSTLALAPPDTDDKTPDTKYNVTECCVGAGISEMCLPLCSYDASMVQLRSLAGVCDAEFHKLVRCSAGGRNHQSCCERRGVPVNCLQICAGNVGTGSPTASPNSCIPFIGNIVQCFEEGTGILPGPVSELHAVKVTNTSVAIEWLPPTDGNQINSYIVYYQQIANTTAHDISLKLVKDIEVKDTKATLSDLESNKIYNIFVVSSNNHGTSLPSSVLLVNITETDLGKRQILSVTSPPHSLSVSSHSANFVTITWQPPEFSHPAENLAYRLHWKASSDENYHIVETALTSHMLSNLTPNSQYIVYATSISKNGESMPSETLIAWTDPAFPAFVEPPTIHPLNSVVEGSSMTILCIAMGTPMPTISLYISGRLVRQETTRHMVTVINNVTRDMNQVSCYADNGYGTPMQASRKIAIGYLPHLSASFITIASVDDTVVLKCNVESYPEPKMMFWSDPDGRRPVIDGGRYNIQIVPHAVELDKYTMQLTINKVANVDEQDYYCHAENAYGSKTQPVSLRIRNPLGSYNITDCCAQQNVSTTCMHACSFYLDIDATIDKPECINDMDKLMKCTSDGSDHRSCCSAHHVPRTCLDWCRGEEVYENTYCLLGYTKPIMSCFREGRSKIPGIPLNIRVELIDSHSVLIKWDPPTKNPKTVNTYRIFWRQLGSPIPLKNETKETSLLITELKVDATYEFVMKSIGLLGTSVLTEPVKFSTEEKYITSAASMGENESHGTAGAALSAVIAFLLVAGVIVATGYYVHSHHILRGKTTNGVAFENPSYLREVNRDNAQNCPSDNTYMSNGLANGVTSQTNGWKQEPLHVPASTEVAPSLYEELRLGSDGAGFMRLKD